jgi:hypothetical protein
METNNIPLPDKRKIVRMEKENVAMDIDDLSAEAEKENQFPRSSVTTKKVKQRQGNSCTYMTRQQNLRRQRFTKVG